MTARIVLIGRGGPGDLPHQLAPHRAGVILETVGDDLKGAGPADDAAAIIQIKIRQVVAAIERVGRVHDGKPVNGDAPLDRSVTHIMDELPPIVGAIAGDIDHPPGALDIIGLDHRGGHIHCIADGRAPARRKRRVEQIVGKIFGACPIVDDPPINHEFIKVSA